MLSTSFPKVVCKDLDSVWNWYLDGGLAPRPLLQFFFVMKYTYRVWYITDDW